MSKWPLRGGVDALLREIYELVAEEERWVAARPRYFWRLNAMRGRALLLRLLIESRALIMTSPEVSARFELTVPQLHQLRKRGAVIAVRTSPSARWLFPIGQFKRGGSHAWAREIVSTVGNGLPAIHFFLVKRQDLDGASFAQIIARGGARSDASPADMIRKALRRISVD